MIIPEVNFIFWTDYQLLCKDRLIEYGGMIERRDQ